MTEPSNSSRFRAALGETQKPRRRCAIAGKARGWRRQLLQQVAACAERVAAAPWCSVYRFRARLVLAVHPGVERALGDRKLREGPGEVVASSNLAVWRVLLLGLRALVGTCTVLQLVDRANRVWNYVLKTGIRVHQCTPSRSCKRKSSSNRIEVDPR